MWVGGVVEYMSDSCVTILSVSVVGGVVEYVSDPC